MIVAIDGPAGAGKSSVAQAVAERLGLQYIDTGAIYRTVAWMASREGIGVDDGEALASLAGRVRLSFAVVGGVNTVTAALGEGAPLEDVTALIRTAEMSQGASRVSVHPPVRAALLELQRRLGRGQDSLLEGRDIGTVIFPDAEVKIFLTASPLERAVRRREQLVEKGGEAGVPAVEAIAAEIRERDERDSTRAVAPLRPAEDAVVVDTTGVPFEEVVQRLVGIVEAVRQGRAPR